MYLPAALRDGLVNGFVNLLVVVVLVPGVLPHVGFEGWRMTAHVAAERAPGREVEKEERGNKDEMSNRVRADQVQVDLICVQRFY